MCPTISLPTFRNVMFHPSAPHLDIHNMQIVKAFESILWYFNIYCNKVANSFKNILFNLIDQLKKMLP